MDVSSELVEQLTKEKDESEARAVEAEAQFITIATLQKVFEICGVAVGSQWGHRRVAVKKLRVVIL